MVYLKTIKKKDKKYLILFKKKELYHKISS